MTHVASDLSEANSGGFTRDAPIPWATLWRDAVRTIKVSRSSHEQEAGGDVHRCKCTGNTRAADAKARVSGARAAVDECVTESGRARAHGHDVSQQKGELAIGVASAMVPHHAGAILMCEKADISDPEIRKLCAQIVKSQLSEIDQMKELLRE